MAPSKAELPLRGLYQLLYAGSGGLKPVHQFYVYNILDNHLTFVDLDNKTIRSKALNGSAVDELNSIFYRADIPNNLTHLKPISCPDCKQYGLSYYIVEPEKLVPISGNAFWDDKTKGTESLHDIINSLVRLSR